MSIEIGTPPDDVSSRRLLEQFVASNPELQQVELLLRKFNIFEALNLVWHELRHSDFLAYLLDPQQNHGLSDSFLKSFMTAVVKGKDRGVASSDILSWNLGEAEVQREWRNIDIFVRDERNQVAVIIENKILSDEHSNQLARYYECVAHEFTGWKIVPIYLTVETEAPSDHRYLAVGYDRVCNVVEDVIKLRQATVNGEVQIFMQHYAEMLRRHHLPDSELSILCRRIYAKHKQALDMIYEHRPDRRQLVRETMEQWIRENPALLLEEKCTKGYVYFLPRQLDLSVLGQGSGWKSGRMLMFAVENNAASVIVKLYIGPGPSEIRQKLFDFAKLHQPQFKPSWGTEWSTIFSKTLLTSKSYEMDDDGFIDALRQKWDNFVATELPQVAGTILAEKWVRESVDTK